MVSIPLLAAQKEEDGGQEAPREGERIMEETKPVTVHSSTYGDIPELQQEGLDRLVAYLTKAITPGILIPATARIVIEWGEVRKLAEIKK